MSKPIPRSTFERLALHAWKIRFTPPGNRTSLEITAPPPRELETLLGRIGEPGSRSGGAELGAPKVARSRRKAPK